MYKSLHDYVLFHCIKQTEEQFEKNERIDKMLYQTATSIRNRLNINKEVFNPSDRSQSLKLIKKDDDRLQRLKDRLDTYISKLDILFDDSCTEAQALEAWNYFFNHNYWNDQYDTVKATGVVRKSESRDSEEELIYDESEEFIQYLFPVENQYQLTLECNVEQNGYRVDTLMNMLRKGKWLSPRKKLNFFISSNAVPKPYDIYWKVKNRGPEAKIRNQVRGRIVKTNSETHTENTQFKGEHFVECFIVKEGICVAKAKIEVPITYKT